MQPDVISGVQERAEQFVAKCTEKPGSEAVDVYVSLTARSLFITQPFFRSIFTVTLSTASRTTYLILMG